MAPQPQSLPWKKSADGGTGQAILFVHGIGNVHAGDYGYLQPAIEKVLGPAAAGFSIYTFYYDQLNDWIAEKVQLAAQLQSLLNLFGNRFGSSGLAQTVAQYAGDILWPVLSLSARQAIQAAYLSQLQRLVKDGIEAGFPANRQRISIICHSLGCFHTYEVLHAAAENPEQGLTPATDGVRFANVIFMASPVQLIRTVAGDLGPLAPKGLACTRAEGLSCPFELTFSKTPKFSADRWVAITGELDPVGGYLFRKQLEWAYMNVKAPAGFPGQVSRINNQDWLGVTSEEDLRLLIIEAMQSGSPGNMPVKDPHSWGDYIVRNAAELKGWLT